MEIGVGIGTITATATTNVSGQQLNISLNSVEVQANCDVFPNSIELTITTGSINIQAWQIVNTGSDVNWNIIDTAA
jgi:hypothetical protein